ncbi:MAG: hypothetical protein ACW990_14620 [Promethearchaeota archaeon]|jgi:hypothetical protein
MIDVLSAIAVLSACAISYLIVQNIKLKQEIEKIKKTPVPSEELTDFLRDVQVNGFSFVRVSPDSVLLRSPNR